MDYNKIFEIKEIKLEWLDSQTLINWNCLNFDDENWLTIEIWMDENNKIKLLETSDDETVEISDMITKEQKEYIYKLIENSIDSILSK